MSQPSGLENPVFVIPDGTDTPILAQGWTVQSANGSDQGLVDGEDIA